ncbi:MAG: hypothetical protein J0L66_07325 [Cytophagales bacterium]|nr:hypothetical protein [Cytophagales bacterium]
MKILSLGISGFCFLLVIMAFRLISKEQEREQPRGSMLTAIYVFMSANLLNVVVVGILGIPAISRNVDLSSEKDKVQKELGIKTNEFNVLQKATDFDKGLDTVSVKNISVNYTGRIDSYVQSLDSLQNSYAAAELPKADSIQEIKNIISMEVLALKSDTASVATRAMALEKINLSNHKLTRLLKTNE